MSMNAYVPRDWNSYLAGILEHQPDTEVLRHFFGFPILGAPTQLNSAAIICLDAEWWQKDPKPTTEIGIAEAMSKGMFPSIHAENILAGIQTAHARIIPHAHLRNNFHGAGDPENFVFGTTKFVSLEEAKQVLIDTFARPRQDGRVGELQPIIMVGHAVENEFEHIESAFGVDLRSYGTIVKVIDTQAMAHEAGIKGPNGPNISLRNLLAHFNIQVPNLHTAGNDAAGTLIAAVMLALQDVLYAGSVGSKPPATVLHSNIQGVVTRVIAIGKSRDVPSWGTATFCTRCGRDNHLRAQCLAYVFCDICHDSGVVRLYNAASTHLTSKCLYNFLELPVADHGFLRRR